MLRRIALCRIRHKLKNRIFLTDVSLFGNDQVWKIFSRPFNIPLQSVLAVMGAVLLAVMFHHSDPWHMSHIPLQSGSENFVALRPVPVIGSLLIPYNLFVMLCLVLLPATLCMFRSAREAAAHLVRSKPALWGLSISLFCFLITFFSGFFLQETRYPQPMYVRSAALYLTLGIYGVVFFFAGVSAYIVDFNIWNRLRIFILTARLPWFLAAIFAAEFLFANLISYFAFDHLPHVQDSVAQVFHGKIFAAGRLTAPSPLLRDFFYYDHIINNGRWYSQYLPGHSLLMMIGVLVGAPWIINPLLGSATIVLLYFLGRELYSDAIGRLAAVLGLFSPFILFMSSEFMNHVTALFLFTLFVLFYARTIRLKSAFSAIIAGASLGWILNIRPLTAVSLALPFTVYACYLLWKQVRRYRKPFLAMALTASVFVTILLAFNYLTNGDPLLFGYQVLHGDEHLPGFGHAAWGEAHTPALGIRHTLNNFVGLNKYLFEWPIPSLTFIVVLFASRKTNRWDRILIFSFCGLAAGYLFYWYQDWCFGPRFLYEAAGVMILLTARGIHCVPHFIREVLDLRVAVRRIYGFATAVLVFCILYGLAANVPALYKTYSSNYWEVNTKLFSVIRDRGIGKAIIFTNPDFGCLLMADSPFLVNDVICVIDRGDLNKKMMALYPGYRYFIAREDRIDEIFPAR